MPLGAFSVSLAVKDLAASREFYEKLGFTAVFGEPEQGWQILRNGSTTAEAGVEFESRADDSTTGPASFVVLDPDGNPVLVDQHV